MQAPSIPPPSLPREILPERSERILRAWVGDQEIDVAAVQNPKAQSSDNAVNRWLDKQAAKAAERAEKAQQKLQGDGWFARKCRAFLESKVGKSLSNWLAADVESVKRDVTVEIEKPDGTIETRTIQVEDADLSLILQRISLGVGIISAIPMVPFVGQILPGVSCVFLAVGAGVSKALGKDHLAKALGKMSLKHLMIVGANTFIPIFGSLVPGTMAVADAKDIKRLTDSAPTIAEANSLAQYKQTQSS